VQTLLGATDDKRRAQQGASAGQANRQWVRIELQADCYAGVWGHHADKDRQIIEAGDLEEALTAAAAVGDDTLQQASGRVRPETFMHGTAKQRVEWFRRGYDGGTIDSCRMSD
jgi:predicted metalloprotease